VAASPEAGAAAERMPPQAMLDVWMGYQDAQLRYHRGDLEGATEALLAAGGGPDLPYLVPNDRQWAWEPMVVCSLVRGDRTAAERWARDAEAWAAECGLPGIVGYAARCRARVSLARGEEARAVEAASTAVASFDTAGNPLEAGHARVLLGECLLAAGRRRDAVGVLQDAERAFFDLGAERWRAGAARALRRLGRRTPARSVTLTAVASEPASLGALSARELEIAELVHEQRTNREIAETLFLSEKTVQSHLRNIFAKLGVGSRVAVAVAVAQARERVAA
jgi:DNA-binding CsgD family transcriptional regulator